MKTIDVKVVTSPSKLTISILQPPVIMQYDNRKHILNFSRPEELEDHELLLLFNDGVTQFEPQLIGKENSFAIVSGLTQQKGLTIQACFVLGDDMLYSNILKLGVDKSLKSTDKDMEIVEVPSLVSQLLEQTTRVTNLTIDLLERIKNGGLDVPQGDTGGTGNPEDHADITALKYYFLEPDPNDTDLLPDPEDYTPPPTENPPPTTNQTTDITKVFDMNYSQSLTNGAGYAMDTINNTISITNTPNRGFFYANPNIRQLVIKPLVALDWIGLFSKTGERNIVHSFYGANGSTAVRFDTNTSNYTTLDPISPPVILDTTTYYIKFTFNGSKWEVSTSVDNIQYSSKTVINMTGDSPQLVFMSDSNTSVKSPFLKYVSAEVV